MLGILADSFKTATRANYFERKDVPPTKTLAKRRRFWHKGLVSRYLEKS